MARYERETKHYDRAVLTHLVETGQATYYPVPDVYVVKTEDGTFAVRSHQIITMPTRVVVVEERVASPMDGYSCKENYDGEDSGPGGVVYDDALALAERYLAATGQRDSVDPLTIVRRILDDEGRGYSARLRAEIAGERPKTARGTWYSQDEQDELLKHFLG